MFFRQNAITWYSLVTHIELKITVFGCSFAFSAWFF
uniref:Uncharacterized protein n=1 Tax=Anguilla anguilla TaxID=7936 RepID=A0A0E9S2K3_ANGAN